MLLFIELPAAVGAVALISIIINITLTVYMCRSQCGNVLSKEQCGSKATPEYEISTSQLSTHSVKENTTPYANISSMYSTSKSNNNSQYESMTPSSETHAYASL